MFHQNIDLFWKNIKSEGNVTLGRFFDISNLLVDAVFLEAEVPLNSLGPFQKDLIKTEQFKKMDGLIAGT